MSWAMSLGVAAVWYFAANRISHGDPRLTLGTLLAFVGYLYLFFGPLRWFTAVVNWMTHAFAGAERVFAVLDSQPEVYDAPDAVSLAKIKGAICFKDVRFSYERGKEVIKGISFDIEAGEMIGLVGKSGAGKSTIINLICRFYDVDSGLITLDGHPLKKIRLEQMRRQMGIVPQDPFLFNASILENIRYGRPEASFDDVVRAARAANAHDFILDKEEGYDAIIGEKGTTLSGGEKQRIAIARAILHDPPVLILDEATSSVDTETEKGIQEAIAYLIKGRTTIAIAHRLSTLRNARRLIVIDDGQIVEMGTHDELLARDGHYAKLVKMQTELNKIQSEAVVWKA
jgi:ATP-binding cassette subfamily B protein